ncbi:hypothetical protein [Flavobacterium facile]|uniref:hypothetical protein n=1 Tax=Flavobacterium facile TaxID=2893174 RepID=UPI002E79428D|nr:hypothetical protein [Flavobacterium sp. T-12]
MKKQTYSHLIQPYNSVTITENSGSKIGTTVKSLLPFADQSTHLLPHAPKMVVREFHLVLQEDNKIYCKEFFENIPSTPQGQINTTQFVAEIAQKKYQHFGL